MFGELRESWYKKSSLAVPKQNYAVYVYKNVRFEKVDWNDEEYIVIWWL